MSSRAEIAVVMTAHNEERFVERAIRSVMHQSLADDAYSVIVVDDGSTDATRHIADRYGERVQVLVNETRQGLPASINRGIRMADTRYVVRVDADDYVHQDFLRVLLLFLDLNPHMDAVACDYLIVDEREQHLERVSCEERPIGCGIMFRKDRLVEIGLYDETFLMAEDIDLRLRFERSWAVHRCELPLYRYRRHDRNMTLDVDRHRKHVARARRKNDVE